MPACLSIEEFRSGLDSSSPLYSGCLPSRVARVSSVNGQHGIERDYMPIRPQSQTYAMIEKRCETGKYGWHDHGQYGLRHS